MTKAITICAAFFLAMVAAAAQQKPSAPDASHSHHAMEHGGFMQGGMHHAMAKNVKLEEKIDAATHTITLRVGPMALPARTSHHKMPQPPDLFWTIPVDAWLLAYTPKLVDSSGNEVPGRVLHHVAFWNENRSDFLCPNKEEHIFGAGSEMTNWVEIPGFGYRAQKGDMIRIETMIHNPWDTPYDKVYLEVKIPYATHEAPRTGDVAAAPNADASANSAVAPVDGSGYGGSVLSSAVRSVYPAWMDVESCGNSGYDLKPGKNVTTGTVPVKYDGVLLGVGGHMHDYAKEIVLENATRKETVATLDAKVNAQGELLSMPVVTFFDRGGYNFAAGDTLKITATYENPTGKILRDGAMGIVVGYFAPANDAAMASLRHKAAPPHEMAGMTHDQ
jgi:hypothetical protein